MLGLLTRLAVIPTITIMLVALASTKIPTLTERASGTRTDWLMVLGSLFLLLIWGLDARLAARPDNGPA